MLVRGTRLMLGSNTLRRAPCCKLDLLLFSCAEALRSVRLKPAMGCCGSAEVREACHPPPTLALCRARARNLTEM